MKSLAASLPIVALLCLTASGHSDTSVGVDSCIPGCRCARIQSRSYGGYQQRSRGYLEVNCSGRGLKAVPDFSKLLQNLQPAFISDLDLSDNEITEITSSDFTLPPTNGSAIVQIQSIDLRRNNISKVEDGAFSSTNIRGLRFLYLSNNQIEVFGENTFFGHEFDLLDLSHNRLRTFPYAIKRAFPRKVRLNNNPIGNLPNDAFIVTSSNDWGVQSITELDLSALGMTTFDSCALKMNETLYSLSTLFLDDNHFTTVTRSFFPCMIKTLGNLSMQRCHIEDIEREAFAADAYRYNTLQYLHLSGNNFTVLGRRWFRYLDDLIELDLSECNITNILRNAFDGTSISDTLNLSYNNIAEIHNLDFYNLMKVRHVDLSHSNIRRITGRPFENMTRLQTLDLSHNSIAVLDGSAFYNLSRLYRLDLSHSKIKELGRNVFRSLISLETLDLSNNNVSEIKSRTFNNLVSLKELRLFHCDIKTLANKSFITLRNLRSLDLSYNQISEISDDVFFGLTSATTLALSHSSVERLIGRPFAKIPYLELLLLDGNRLTNEKFVAALHGNRFIHTLDLSHNMLTKVPNLQRRDFPDLTNMLLGYNNITVVRRADLAGMSYIRELILKENGIEMIEDDAFAECSNITLLDLDSSRFSVLPDLSYMPQLRNLHLDHGRLTVLPADMCQGHPHLTILKVEDNLLTELPSFAKCNPGLTIAIFSHNRIRTLRSDTFARQGLLRYLDLEDNLISVLPEGLFDDTRSLEKLYLAENSLTELSPQLFEKLIHLVIFDASHNSIKKLENGQFKNNTEMDILLLNNNKISEIDDTAFPEYSELRRLDLSYNEFSSWRLPSTGFRYLAHLVLKGLERLLHVPSKYETPRVTEIEYTYAYHCCIWSEYATDIVYHDDETLNSSDQPPTEIPTSPDPIFPPGWDSCSPDKKRELQQIQALQETWNFTVELLPDCKFQIHYTDPAGDVPVEEDDFSPVVDEVVDNLESRLDEETQVDYTRQVLCTPRPDALNPCENLMDPMFLRVAIWAIWVIALLGNGTVLFVAIGALEKLETYQFIICNLAIADFFMGIYLAFLAIVDIRTFGKESFYQSALSWQFGPGCQTAGFIAVFASELSMYMLVLLTVERVYTISYGFNQSERCKMKFAIIFAIIGWLFALFLAALPLLGINSYTKVAVCLPYMTTNWYDKAYIGFLISVNMVGFLIILLSYCYIFYRIRKSPAQPPTKKGTIVTAALKISVLIVSALICWAPIAVIGYAALAGRSIVSVYQAKFFIVFVYPFNACINPFIYAIFTRHFRHKIGSIFKRTKDKVTSFPPQHNLRLQHRGTAFMFDYSCGRVNSPRTNPSPEELRRMRQSRRSNSYSLHYVDPAATAVVQSPSPTTRIAPPTGVYLGRRSSLPAAFGSTLAACAPCRSAGTNDAPVYPLPFRLGPLYSSGNGSLSNLEEETEMSETTHVEGERASFGGSQDSSLRRLSIVKEEEEVDEIDFKGVKLECDSASSSDSEDYIEAREHPVEVVIEKSTDLDAAILDLTHEEVRSRTKNTTTKGASSANGDESRTPSKRNGSTSSLHNVVVEDLRESPEDLSLDVLERPCRVDRGMSKLSTDSACSGYGSSTVDESSSKSTADEAKADGERGKSSDLASDDKDNSEVRRKTSSSRFEDARSQPTLGDSTSIDSGSCHDLATPPTDKTDISVDKEQENKNSNYTLSSKTDSNNTNHSPSPTVDQESVHSPRSHSHSHSSVSHSQTGFSNPTFHVKSNETDTMSTTTQSDKHSADCIGITKSETDI